VRVADAIPRTLRETKTKPPITAMNKHHRYYLEAAFTLIEILVVVAIIALLAGIAGPAINMAMKTAKIARQLKTDGRSVWRCVGMHMTMTAPIRTARILRIRTKRFASCFPRT
jgi:prepilin-type N-terminal cleavage/methylation domain-containing protein